MRSVYVVLFIDDSYIEFQIDISIKLIDIVWEWKWNSWKQFIWVKWRFTICGDSCCEDELRYGEGPALVLCVLDRSRLFERRVSSSGNCQKPAGSAMNAYWDLGDGRTRIRTVSTWQSSCSARGEFSGKAGLPPGMKRQFQINIHIPLDPVYSLVSVRATRNDSALGEFLVPNKKFSLYRAVGKPFR